ncbi:MAG: tyrosine decarboxylase MfnA [Thermoplasmata archaeon]
MKKHIEDLSKLLDFYYKKNVHFKDGKIFNSMCTAPLPYTKKSYIKFIESNLGNPLLYTGTKEMHDILINELKKVMHLKGGYGYMTSGGTEGNITSLWIARNYTKKTKVLLTKTAHFSILKAINLLGMEGVYIKVNDQYQMNIEDLKEKLDENTACIVTSAGSTELGIIDPIEEISDIANGKFMVHVDAAFGGFVIPFLSHLKKYKFDFSLKSVKTLIADFHKMGMAPVPSSVLLMSNQKMIESIKFETPYLSTNYNYTLLGTRPSGAVASSYAALYMLGEKGYTEIVNRCWKNTQYMKNRFEKLGIKPIVEPIMNILTAKTKNSKKIQENLYQKGYYVSLVKDPPGLRFVIMPHIKKAHIDNLINELEKNIHLFND